METINLNQLTVGEAGTYLHGEIPFSGFAIETFPDGRLLTHMSLMHGQLDGVTRRWHPNGQLESEKSYRNGDAHGCHQGWRDDGVLRVDSEWLGGACRRERLWDEQARVVQETQFRDPADTLKCYEYNPEGKLIAIRSEAAI
jgi:antitoxin component YwqK of YwqJK toxin-antitoxin module